MGFAFRRRACIIQRGLVLLLAVGILTSCSHFRGTPPDRDDDRVYLVQLDMTEDKSKALRIREEGKSWWADRPSSQKPPLASIDASARPVAVVWKAPLYRVRLGPFSSRDEAESVLTAARRVFPDAFIVPDQIEGTEK